MGRGGFWVINPSFMSVGAQNMRDTFNDWKRSKNSKRAANRRDGLALIRSLGVDFLCKNGGAHLIVWPNAKLNGGPPGPSV